MKLKNILARGLQIAGALALVLLAGYALINGLFSEAITGSSRIDQELVSPDGKHRAILALTSTGAVGYCYQFIVLLPANAPVMTPSYGESQERAVFIAQCHNKTTLAWLDATNLKVSLKLDEYNDVFSARMRKEDSGSHVAMHYEVSNQ